MVLVLIGNSLEEKELIKVLEILPLMEQTTLA